MSIILEKKSNKSAKEYFLCFDIGGTITQIGILTNTNKPEIIYEAEVWSKKVSPFPKLVKQVLEQTKDLMLNISGLGIAVAGPIKGSKAYGDNLGKTIDITKIKQAAKIKNVVFINDFEALGNYINLIQKGKKDDRHALIGPGTGLGKATLRHDGKSFVVTSGEGSNSEFPIRNLWELEFKMFVTKDKQDFLFQDVVTGPGIQNIYTYLRQTGYEKESKYTKEIEKSKEKVFLITKYKDKDKTCKETFRLFSQFYARAAKNYAIEAAPIKKLYLAGGITARNPEIINSDFKKELKRLNRGQKVISDLKIEIIKEKDTSLKGLAYVLRTGKD